MPTTTMGMGINLASSVPEQYVPPNVVPFPLDSGVAVEWGPQVAVEAGDSAGPPGVIVMFVGGAPLQATGPALIRVVTITGSAPT
jgi:hypothetical protein